MAAPTRGHDRMPETLYDQVVFSGGGTRCMWQGGFMDVLRAQVPIAPRRITGVSGGACTGCGFLTNRGPRVRDTFIERFAQHDRNLPLHEPFDDETGNSPHQQIYRDIIEVCFGDPEARKTIADGPEYHILLARPPDHDWPKLSGAAMTMVYVADTHLRSTPHLKWAEKAGLRAELINANVAARSGDLTDLVCAAATIPPAFDPPDWDGAPAVDAGMADQAPLPENDDGRTLILLTKRFRNIPEDKRLTYVQPSKSVPADKIDFTDPDKLRETWAMGEDDARRFLRDHKNLLKH